jgi:hypothetical protein
MDPLMRRAKRQRAVDQAVENLGGPVATADRVGVRYQSVYLWQKQGFVTDLVYAYRLARASGIDIAEFVRDVESARDLVGKKR